MLAVVGSLDAPRPSPGNTNFPSASSRALLPCVPQAHWKMPCVAELPAQAASTLPTMIATDPTEVTVTSIHLARQTPAQLRVLEEITARIDSHMLILSMVPHLQQDHAVEQIV